MRATGTSQSALARMSGIHQPSISQFLTGRIAMSDTQLDRLLACMGYRLEVVTRAVRPELTRSERRSWLLHRDLATVLNPAMLEAWRPMIQANLARLRSNVFGQPHARNIDQWGALVERADLAGMHRALTGLDRSSIEMREVSPFSGLLPEERRVSILQDAG